MKLCVILVSAACLSIFVAPAPSTHLLAAASAVKGAIIGAGLTALKPGGSSETVIIQSAPGTVAEVIPSNQIIVQDLAALQPAQTITYTASNPISRLLGAVTDTIAAKAQAFSNLFSPNPVVVVPQTTAVKPIDVHQLGLPVIGVELNNKPLLLPNIDIELNHKPLSFPSIGLSASIEREMLRRVHPVALMNYLKK